MVRLILDALAWCRGRKPSSLKDHRWGATGGNPAAKLHAKLKVSMLDKWSLMA